MAGIGFEEVLPRYALIIGTANYRFAPLKNPKNDATDMATKLEDLRYKVTLVTDQNPAQIHQSVRDFYHSIKEKNAISLFYYAGHAIQAEGHHFLIPVNAGITSYEKMKTASLSLNEVFSAIRQSRCRQRMLPQIFQSFLKTFLTTAEQLSQ